MIAVTSCSNYKINNEVSIFFNQHKCSDNYSDWYIPKPPESAPSSGLGIVGPLRSSKLANHHLCVVRASDNQRLVDSNKKLFEEISDLDIAGRDDVHVKQKGGRKARTAKIAISYTSVKFKKPQRTKAKYKLEVNIIV